MALLATGALLMTMGSLSAASLRLAMYDSQKPVTNQPAIRERKCEWTTQPARPSSTLEVKDREEPGKMWSSGKVEI
jgi:hypothetical protein